MNQKRKISLMLVIILILQIILPIVINAKVVAIEDVNIEKEQVVNNSKKEVDTNLQTIKFGSYANENEDIEKNTEEIVKESTKVLEDTENISEAYLEWAELSDEEKQKTIQPREEFVDMSVLDGLVTSTSILPSKYNLRDKINIKTENQSPYGNCYAYAGLNSIETNIALKTGLTYDFSEMHVEYMTSDLLEGNRTLNEGGNFQTVVNYSKDLFGPVLESEIPNKKYTEDEYTLLRSAKPIVTITETVEFPTINKRYGYTAEELEEFRDSVKSHIKENGSVYASMYFSESNKYYNNSTKSYCCLDTSIMTNHAVSIIGWDDNFSKDNFPESNRPISNGAWIALNSHGSSFGDNGIFYISYEDNWIEYNMSGVVSTKEFIDTYGPEIDLVNYTDENNTISSTINVYDIGGSGINGESLKYVWSQSEYEPNIEDFTESFTNGSTLTKKYKDGEKWYLWILAYDNNENYSIYGAGVVTIKFNDKTLYEQIKGVDVRGINDYIYGYNDETYEVQILKTELDKITSLSVGSYLTSAPNYPYPPFSGHNVYIEDLSGIEMFRNLQSLNFNAKSGIKNIEVLQKLDKLTELIIDNGLDNIEFIENMNSLQSLTLREQNHLNDINISFPNSINYLNINNCENLVSANANYPKNLQKLSITNCKSLTDISDINFPDAIYELRLSNNSIKDISQVNWPHNLKYLSLTSNEMEVVNGSKWSDNLEILDLSFNNISDITNINLPNGLIELYIGDNEIIDISNLRNLINIQLFSAGSNYIENISVIENMTNLKEVYFGSTVWWCYYFYNGSGPYSNCIAYSRDHGNNIKSVNIKWPKSITKLELDNNKIEILEDIDFPTGITKLDLSYNEINKISLEIDNLRYVYLNNNNISDISGIKVPNAKTNRELNLADNNIKEINAEWTNGGIDTLVLSNNNISSIDNVVWPKNLDSLALNNNNINLINSSNFGNNLRYLILNNNNISEMGNITWPESLQAIEVAENNITDLSWIESGINLRGIALNNNKIKNIESLSVLSKLQELHLDNNFIEDISLLESLSSLNSLSVKRQYILKVIQNNESTIELPQIIKSSTTTGSKVYSENVMTQKNCSISGENIAFDINELGNIYIMINGGNADGTIVYITDSIDNQLIKSVYKVKTKEDLVKIRDNVVNNGFHDLSNSVIELENDIDLGGTYNETTQEWEGETWVPLGTKDYPFAGEFEGNGYKITGLYINSDTDYQGLIGYNRGIIQNLTVEGYITTTGGYVGGICGYNVGTSEDIEKIPTIRNTKSNVEIESTGQFTGGICGRNATALIEDCYNVGKITGGNDTGGIVGGNTVHISSASYETTSVVSKCYNTGEVNGENEVGGICGTNSSMNDPHGRNYVVIDCYNIGNVFGNCWVGGIVGDARDCSKVENCYNLGEVGRISNYQSNVGSIIGTSYGITQNCYYPNTSNIKAINNKDDEENKVYALSTLYMKTSEFVSLLNKGREENVWKLEEGTYKYPVLEWQTTYPDFTNDEESIWLTEITVTKVPDNTTYIEGQNFNPTGMVVMANYNDGSSKAVTNYTVTDGNNLAVGKTSVTISYTENDITKTTTQAITVKEKEPEKLIINIKGYEEKTGENIKYIKGISPQTTLEDFKNSIETNGKIGIKNKTTEITDINAKICTGMILEISLNNEKQEYTVVVIGDCNGSGTTNVADLTKLMMSRAESLADNKDENKILKGAYAEAADLNNDGKISVADITKLCMFIAENK